MRHKLIKNMNLDEELDDFDGGEEYYDDEPPVEQELSAEDQEQMRIGTINVRSQLPDNTNHVTDKQIQEALWDYYYDEVESVAYLVKTYGRKTKKITQTPAAILYYCASQAPSSIKDFFYDMPWYNTPQERHTTFVPLIKSPGGLLGGSEEAPPKLSKIQQLAAARKKKAQEQKYGNEDQIERPMAGLDINAGAPQNFQTTENVASTKPTNRGLTLRKRKDSNPHEKPPPLPPPEKALEAPSVELETPAEPDHAEPSAFASTMFGRGSSATSNISRPFSLPYSVSDPQIISKSFSGPSPDDIVLAAQAGSKAKVSSQAGKVPPKTAKDNKSNTITNGVQQLKIDDTPKAKSKNLDVLKEFEKARSKKAANFVVIGHVDAGKSTLMGRLLYDLNVIDQRTIDRYKKEAESIGKSSFAFAWVLDQGTEERARGVTIDIASNKFETDTTSFTILDAPGHRDFVPNMIAGAAQADFAVLVVDAGTGEFEAGLKGQTKEHALLVRSMGVQRIIIAVNKLDTVNWSEERFTEIQQQISAFLTAAGFQPKNISFVPCSGLNGDNITRRSTEATASWYKGLTLIEELESSEPVARALNKPLRITIGDIFRGGVQNPLSISGRIEAGSLQVGDALLVQPSSQKAFVKALEVDNESKDWAVAGQNVVIHLSGIEEQYLRIGDVVCSPALPIQNIKTFTAKVLAFEFLMPMSVEVHRGRLHTPAKVKELLGVVDKATGKVAGKKKPRIVKPGQVARVVVELEQSVPLEVGARVVLRSGGETVGAGLLE